MAQMNSQVLTNLDRMISEVENDDEAGRRRCGLTTPATSSPPRARRAEQTRARAVAALRRMDCHGHPDHLRRRRPRGRRLPLLALHPTRPPRPRSSASGNAVHRQPSTPVPPDRQRASDTSLLRRLEAATERIRRLEEENQQLRDALARALGERRTADIIGRPHARDTPNEPPKVIGPC